MGNPHHNVIFRAMSERFLGCRGCAKQTTTDGAAGSGGSLVEAAAEAARKISQLQLVN